MEAGEPARDEGTPDQESGSDQSTTGGGCFYFGCGAFGAAFLLVAGYIVVTYSLPMPQRAKDAAFQLVQRVKWPAGIAGGLAYLWHSRGEVRKARVAFAIAVLLVLGFPIGLATARLLKHGLP